MYLKTTSPQFAHYGKVSDYPSEYKTTCNIYEAKKLDRMRTNSHPVSFEVIEGIAVLVVEENDQFSEYVIHRRAILNAHVPYAIIPLTSKALVEESVQTYDTYQEIVTTAQHNLDHIPIRPSFYISDIFSYYYGVKGQRYHFDGESHKYWEITYVDTGELMTELDGESFTLESQDMMIFLPGQFHRQSIREGKSSSYFTIMFDMTIDEHYFEPLRNKVIHCTQQMYNLITQFIKQSNILEGYDIPFTRDLMVSYLQELIILMLQCDISTGSTQISNSNPVQHKFESEMIDEISNFVLNEIYNPITVEDICNHFGIGRSTLQALFKKHIGVPPKQYINDLKMKQAQRIIMQENIPITEVSLRLGFSSIHYFSRKFKKEFGISPSEFAQSVYKPSHNTQ